MENPRLCVLSYHMKDTLDILPLVTTVTHCQTSSLFLEGSFHSLKGIILLLCHHRMYNILDCSTLQTFQWFSFIHKRFQHLAFWILFFFTFLLITNINIIFFYDCNVHAVSSNTLPFQVFNLLKSTFPPLKFWFPSSCILNIIFYI